MSKILCHSSAAPRGVQRETLAQNMSLTKLTTARESTSTKNEKRASEQALSRNKDLKAQHEQ